MEIFDSEIGSILHLEDFARFLWNGYEHILMSI